MSWITQPAGTVILNLSPILWKVLSRSCRGTDWFDGSWVFPIGILPKRKIAIIKTKGVLIGSDLNVESNLIIANGYWKARKGCVSISVHYCIKRLCMNKEIHELCLYAQGTRSLPGTCISLHMSVHLSDNYDCLFWSGWWFLRAIFLLHYENGRLISQKTCRIK